MSILLILIINLTKLFFFSVCPIFLASSVTGQNLDRLKKFLHVLPPSHNSVEQDKLAQELTEYQVF